jgi:hypothetical protein
MRRSARLSIKNNYTNNSQGCGILKSQDIQHPAGSL